MNLRPFAAYQECQVRLPGCTTYPCVLAHVRIVGSSGLGMKISDIVGAHACDHCHRAYDTRGRGDRAKAIELAFLRGVARTMDSLARRGLIVQGEEH